MTYAYNQFKTVAFSEQCKVTNGLNDFTKHCKVSLEIGQFSWAYSILKVVFV